MANTKSALKMIRVSERKRIRNKPIRSATKTYVARAERMIALRDTDAATAAVMKAMTELDKAASKGIIHRNNAARRKSRLMRKLNLAQSASA